MKKRALSLLFALPFALPTLSSTIAVSAIAAPARENLSGTPATVATSAKFTPHSIAASKAAKLAPAAGKDELDATSTTDKVSDDDNAAPKVDANYSIRPGDVLQITVWKEDSLDREVLVLPDGSINFPLIGSFKAAGMSPASVQNTVKTKLKTLIPDASVTVQVKATLGHSVNVIGQVTKPGELLMGHHMTVIQALSQAGGLTPYAKESKIIVLRKEDGKEISIPFPYDEISEGRSLEKNIELRPGDVIVVPTAGLF